MLFFHQPLDPGRRVVTVVNGLGKHHFKPKLPVALQRLPAALTYIEGFEAIDKTVDSFLCACLHVVNETAFERPGHERRHADDDERARDQEGQEQLCATVRRISIVGLLFHARSVSPKEQMVPQL